MVLSDLVHKCSNEVNCDLVNSLVIVTILREIALNFVVSYDSVLISDALYLSVLDSRK